LNIPLHIGTRIECIEWTDAMAADSDLATSIDD